MNTILKDLLRNPLQILDRKVRAVDQETFNTMMYCITGALVIGTSFYFLPEAFHVWHVNLVEKYLNWIK